MGTHDLRARSSRYWTRINYHTADFLLLGNSFTRPQYFTLLVTDIAINGSLQCDKCTRLVENYKSTLPINCYVNRKVIDMCILTTTEVCLLYTSDAADE